MKVRVCSTVPVSEEGAEAEGEEGDGCPARQPGEEDEEGGGGEEGLLDRRQEVTGPVMKESRRRAGAAVVRSRALTGGAGVVALPALEGGVVVVTRRTGHGALPLQEVALPVALCAVVLVRALQAGLPAGPALVGLEVVKVARTAGLHTVSGLTGR